MTRSRTRERLLRRALVAVRWWDEEIVGRLLDASSDFILYIYDHVPHPYGVWLTRALGSASNWLLGRGLAGLTSDLICWLCQQIEDEQPAQPPRGAA